MPQIKSILCPVDFSEFSVNAYEYAQSLAWHYKAKLFLQHVLYSLRPLDIWNIYPDSYEESCRKERAEVEQQLQEFAKRNARTEIQPQCFVQDGSTPDLILSLAEAQAANLIVMGHSRIARS
jgi:universal stress protein A